LNIEYKFFLSYALVMISMYVIYKEKIGLEKDVLISSIRAFFSAFGTWLYFNIHPKAF